MINYSRYYSNGEVVDQSIQESIETLVGLVPLRKVHKFNIIAHVKGLNNARMPALVDLLGIAESFNIKEDKSSRIASTQQFIMNNRTYDSDSKRNGTISKTIYTWGFLGEKPMKPMYNVILPYKWTSFLCWSMQKRLLFVNR